MGVSRRTFLKLGTIGAALAAGGAAGWHWLRNRTVPQLDADQRQLLRACVDVLVPSDEYAPGALDLGIDEELVAASRGDVYLRRLLWRGGEMLDRQARGLGAATFATLAPARQVALLEAAEAAPRSQVERRLFDRLRAETMERYYARPESWGQLYYSGPPQPAGYMDYTQPPRPRA